MFSLYYHELMGKIKEYDGKKYFMVDDNILDKVSDKIKKIISIKKFDDIKVLIDIDDKLPDDIFKKLVFMMNKHENNVMKKLCLKNISPRKRIE